MISTFLRTGLFVSILFYLLFTSVSAIAQEVEKDNNNFKIRSFGLSIGIYDPELDYWKSDTNSQFKDAEFSTNIFANGFVELNLVSSLVAKLGIGYWQTRAETIIPKFGKTEMLLTGNPVSLDLIYYVAPLRLAFVTPYVGVGGEYTFIQYSLDFEDKENPDPVNGSSALLSGMVGLELAFSEHFALDLFAEYKQGTYQQNFIRQINNPNPEMPDAEMEVTENISLSGPKLGFSLKYLF
jgi:hypothetical protein